jgi:Ras-related C3 botulinum toxin substrate 1
MVLNDKMNVSLGLWDTAGQDDYEQMRPLAYPGTHVFLVCFSLVNAVSLENVRLKWVKEIKSFSEDVPLVLCGTKLDLYEDANYRKLMEDRGEQAVTEEQIKKVAEEIGASAYVLCSGKTQRNMSEVFKQCAIAGLIYQGVLKAPDKKPSSSKSNDGSKPQSGDGCCTIC